MNRAVIITPAAQEDIREIHRYIARDSRHAASVWSASIRRHIKALSRNPERCPIAEESRTFGDKVRVLLTGKGNRGTYRILFVILDARVFVIHVRHGSREPADFSEN